MKKYFISGVLALAVSAVFTGCSKSTDLYDAEAVQKNQNEQKVAELRKAYNEAFKKEFGSIASGHKWGFDLANVNSTRGGAFSISWEGVVMPEVIRNSDGKDFDGPFNASNDIVTELPDFIKSGNYILQHVFKQVNKGGKSNGHNDAHHQLAQLQAYDFNADGWKNVDNFGSECGGNNGKNVFSVKDDDGKQFTKGCTVMGSMGNPDTKPNQPLFQWFFSGNSDFAEESCSNYIIKRVDGEYYLGLSYGSNSNEYDAWIIKLLPVETISPFTSRGRVFCEDLGLGGDIDFNDVVFDAEILEDGAVKITIQAAGGTLPIYVAGKKVELGQMKNTGLNNPLVGQQVINLTPTQAQAMGISTVADIPVYVEKDGLRIDIVNLDGQAPGKICTYIGVPWADEYINIQKAYPNFKMYVNNATPADWYFDMVDDFVDLNLSNNNQ